MTDPADAFARIVPWVRSQFPQIETTRDGEHRTYLDNAAGTLVPESVASAMADAALWANPQPHRTWPAATETDRLAKRTRTLLGDFLNAGPDDRIYLSESTTASLFKLREALEPQWGADSRLIVTDCDHFANVSPWEWRAEGHWEVARVRMMDDGRLDLDSLEEAVTAHTRVAALPLASNGLGTRIQVEAAVAIIRARAPAAWIVVDAVHGAPHVPLDVQALGADAVAFSTYKLFGPFAGVLWIRGERLAELSPYHVEPHTDPATILDWGTANTATLAGITAALTYLSRLGERMEPVSVGQSPGFERPRRLFKLAMGGVQAYEAELSRRVLTGLARRTGITLLGVREPHRTSERVPTFAFVGTLENPAWEEALWRRGRIQVAAGNHYAGSLLRGLDSDGAVRASFAHYNSLEDVELFLRTVDGLCTEARVS